MLSDWLPAWQPLLLPPLCVHEFCFLNVYSLQFDLVWFGLLFHYERLLFIFTLFTILIPSHSFIVVSIFFPRELYWYVCVYLFIDTKYCLIVVAVNDDDDMPSCWNGKKRVYYPSWLRELFIVHRKFCEWFTNFNWNLYDYDSIESAINRFLRAFFSIEWMAFQYLDGNVNDVCTVHCIVCVRACMHAYECVRVCVVAFIIHWLKSHYSSIDEEPQQQ